MLYKLPHITFPNLMPLHTSLRVLAVFIYPFYDFLNLEITSLEEMWYFYNSSIFEITGLIFWIMTVFFQRSFLPQF